MPISACRLPHCARRGLLTRLVACAALAGAASSAPAEEHVPAPAPAGPAAQPQPVHPATPFPGRPHQTVEVIPVENAEALAAKLKELVESGLFITAVTAITANGQPAVVVVGMPQPMPVQRAFPPPHPLPPGGQAGAPAAGSPPAQPQPQPQPAPPPPPKP